jgi:maltoporin
MIPVHGHGVSGPGSSMENWQVGPLNFMLNGLHENESNGDVPP